MFLLNSARTAETARSEASPSQSDELARFLPPVREAIAAGAKPEIVRHYRVVCHRIGVTCDSQHIKDLRNLLGEEGLAALVTAFAEAPCLHCQGGIDRCPACEGSGRTFPDDIACAQCLTLGATPCDFCGGSGLEPYEMIPSAFQAIVAEQRAATAASLLASEPDPLPRQATAAQLPGIRKGLARAVHSTRRTLAIARNAAIAAREMRIRQISGRAFTASLFVRSAATARDVRRLLIRCFRALATTSAHMAALKPQSADFEREREGIFRDEAARLLRSSARSKLFPGR